MTGKNDWHRHVEIMSCDLAGYSKLPSHEKRAVKARLNDLVMSCVPGSAESLGWADAGDGGFLFLDGAPGCALKTVRLIVEAQDDRSEDLRLSLRFALHLGRIHATDTNNGPQYSGSALDHCARILDGMPRDPAGMIVGSDAYAEMIRDESHPGEMRQTPLKQIVVKGQAFGFMALHFPSGVGAKPWFFQEREDRFPDDRDEIKAWFETQPQQVIAGLSARAALRVVALPDWAAEKPEFRSAILPPMFCAMAAASFASKWPKQAAEVAAAAAGAAAANANAAGAAANAAANAAYVANAAANAANAAARAAAAAANAARAAYVAAAAAAAAARAAFLKDCRAIDAAQRDAQKFSEVMTGPLWPDGTPEFAEAGWQRMKELLLAEDKGWDIWTDWYEDRLKGARSEAKTELARIKAVGREDYRQGAAHVNRLIAEAEARAKTPVSEEPEVNPRSGKVEYRGEAPEADDLFDGLRRLLRPLFQMVADSDGNDFLGELKAPVNRFDKLTGADDATAWLVQVEMLRVDIARIGRHAPQFRADGTVASLVAYLKTAEMRISARFPDHAEEAEARRGQEQREPDAEEREAIEQAVEAFADILEARIQADIADALDPMDDLGESIGRDVPVEMDGLSIRQKQRLYRLKGLFLRLKEIVDRPRGWFEKAFENSVEAAKKIEHYRKAHETLSGVWDVLWRYFTSG